MSRLVPVLVIFATATAAFADAPAKTPVDGAAVVADRLARILDDETKVEERGGAVVVVAVAAGGAFDALGLRAGDVVVAIDGEYVTSALSFDVLGTRLTGKDVTYLEVVRKKKPLLLRRVVTGRVVAPATPPAGDELDAYVKHLGGTRWEVDVDPLLADPMKVAKGARVVPSIKNGKPNGFKLYAVRPNSLYARLGLTNGDTIVRVNGMTLDTMESSLEVYTKVRDAKEVIVEIVRRGKPLTHTYVRKTR